MKIYDVCGGCGNIIQVNKFIFGSMHVCEGSAEGSTTENTQYLRNKYFHNKDLLNKHLKSNLA